MKTWRLLAMGICAAQAAAAQTITIAKDTRTLEVSGVGTASAEPEIAKVHVGFITYGASLKEAYKSAADLSTAIAKALNGAGAAKSDIESQAQTIAALDEQELKDLRDSRRGMKYRAAQSWTVRVAIDQVAKTLDAAVQSGANNSGQVDWLMKDATALERQAMSKATARARALAEEMAAGMGVKLGALLYVANQPEMVFALGRSQNNAGIADAVSFSQGAPLQIGAQRIERTTVVKAVYAIE